jgi:hypothetical protein
MQNPDNKEVAKSLLKIFLKIYTPEYVIMNQFKPITTGVFHT